MSEKITLDEIDHKPVMRFGEETISTTDFLTKAQNRESIYDITFPKHLIYAQVSLLQQYCNGATLVFQYPPAVRRVNWMWEQRTLSFPYIIFVAPFYAYRDVWNVSTRTVGIFFSGSEIQSLQDAVCLPALLNVVNNDYESHACACFPLYIKGSDGKIDLTKKVCQVSSLREAVSIFSETFSRYFETSFNDDYLTHSYLRYRGTDIFPIHNWMLKTTEDPSFVTKFDWIKVGSLKDVMKKQEGRAFRERSVIETFMRTCFAEK